MNNEYKSFVNECIKNRTYLQFTYKDMENCLINVSAKEYEDFEKLKYKMTKENLVRIARVLCINKPTIKNISNYIEIEDLSKEELKDITNIISTIVGDDNA